MDTGQIWFHLASVFVIVVKAILSLNFNINSNNNKSNNAFKLKKMGIWDLLLYVSELPCVPLVLRILVCFWVSSICSQIFWQSIYWLSSFASSEIHPFGLFKFYCLICFVQHSWLPCSLCTRPWWSLAYFIGSPLNSNFYRTRVRSLAIPVSNSLTDSLTPV